MTQAEIRLTLLALGFVVWGVTFTLASRFTPWKVARGPFTGFAVGCGLMSGVILYIAATVR